MQWGNTADTVRKVWDRYVVNNPGTVTMVKRNTNFAIDGGWNGANGQNVYLWESSNANINQHWKFE